VCCGSLLPCTPGSIPTPCWPGRTADDTPCAFLVDQNGWLATFVMDEGVRDDALAAIQGLQQAGLGTRLLSGDREAPPGAWPDSSR
jgi:cation transport ATPase